VAASVDAGVVSSVDEIGDVFGRLVEQLCDRGGDDHADRETELAGGVAEFDEKLVWDPEAAYAGDPAPRPPDARLSVSGRGVCGRLVLVDARAD